mgnify:CR=1 FL=1
MRGSDELGNLYEYNPENGLISRNDTIISGSDYEPVFMKYPNNEAPPECVGILNKLSGKVLTMSGRWTKVIDSKSL